MTVPTGSLPRISRMRLVSFTTDHHGDARAGVILPQDPESLLDLTAAGVTPTIDALVEAGASAVEEVRGAIEAAPSSAHIRPTSRVRLLSPLRPASLKDFIAFEDHARAGASRRGETLSDTWFDRPLWYKGNHRSIIGPDEPLIRPSFTSELDFELEVACIIGGRGRSLDEGSAAQAIFGFTVMNDWSARDVQRVEMAGRLGPARSKDFATSLGPCILTADEAGPTPSLTMTAKVNGELLCEADLGAAHWSFPRLIAFVSEGEEVLPRDVYGSGTPFGGCLLDHGGPWLEPGDTVELAVEGIGVLRNRVVE
jgi:2-keto-4-pentenoate hydratase/2-oxohepta-3-ene-1,7-dioic acid hydratase in catechol pathway